MLKNKIWCAGSSDMNAPTAGDLWELSDHKTFTYTCEWTSASFESKKVVRVKSGVCEQVRVNWATLGPVSHRWDVASYPETKFLVVMDVDLAVNKQSDKRVLG